jgi:hypothetical protein
LTFAQEQGAVRTLQQDSKTILDTEKQQLADLEEKKTTITEKEEEEKAWRYVGRLLSVLCRHLRRSRLHSLSYSI